MLSFQSTSSWKLLGETRRNARLVTGSFQSSWLQTEVYTHISLLLFSEERKYKCHLCPYAAKCRANLNQHLTVHSVKLVSTDTEDIVSAVTAEGSDGKKHPYYYRWAPARAGHQALPRVPAQGVGQGHPPGAAGLEPWLQHWSCLDLA